MNRKHITLLILVFIVFVWSAIHPRSYLTWALEVVPVTIGILVLVFTYRKFQFSTLSYTIVAGLTILILIGGHYTYAEVPLFEWIQDQFHLKRNNYDRVGHFFKGAIIIVLREFMIRTSLMQPSKLLVIFLLSAVLSMAALYEIAEWLAAVIMGKSADDFLGTQGDVWDAEWDMALALVGGILALCIYSIATKRKNQTIFPE